MFPDDVACTNYLKWLRWPTGFVCSACGSTEAPWHQTRGRLVCPACRHQGSTTAGTLTDTIDDMVRGSVARNHCKERPVGEDSRAHAWHAVSRGLDDPTAV